MKIKIKKLREGAMLPAYQSEVAAGADLYAAIKEPVTLAPMGRAIIPTGIAAEPEEEDCVLLVSARSGLAVKKGVTLSNGIGVIDADYRGEIGIGLVNLGMEEVIIEPGERIAQLLILPILRGEFVEADSLTETERGSGGFGHTGTK